MTTGTYLASFSDGQVPQSLVFPTGAAWTDLGFYLSTDVPTGSTGVYSLAWPQTATPGYAWNTTRSVTLTLNSDASGSTVSFAKKLTTDSAHSLRFYVDNVLQQTWTGSSAWATAAFTAASGSHAYKWSYVRGSSGVTDDIVQIADIAITNVGVPARHSPSFGHVSYNIEDGQLPSGAGGSGGYPTWEASTTRPISGSYSLKSASITNNGQSWLVLGDSIHDTGVLNFDYRTSSETGYDLLKFYVNGTGPCWRMSGNEATGSMRLVVPSGASIAFAYTKDSSDLAGDDAVWIDNLLVPWATGSNATPDGLGWYISSSDLKVELDTSTVGSLDIGRTVSGHSSIALNTGMLKNSSIVRYPMAQNLQCELRLYEDDGQTFVALLPKARNVQWQDELSSVGSASFELPLNDANTALIESGMVVKFSWKGVERFGCFISKENCTVVKEESHDLWLKFEGQLGCGSLFKRAVVFPEWNLNAEGTEIHPSTVSGVLTNVKTAKRLFGYMSYDGGWMVPVEWETPMGIRHDQAKPPTHIYAQYNPQWNVVDRYAYWIDAPPGPFLDVDRAPGEVHYFRGKFTINSSMFVRIWMSADNSGVAYLDGQPLFGEEPNSIPNWESMKYADVYLYKGEHLIALRVQNAIAYNMFDPMAMICAIQYKGGAGYAPTTYSPTVEYSRWDMVTGPESLLLSATGINTLNALLPLVKGTTPTFEIAGYAAATGAYSEGELETQTQAQGQAIFNYLQSRITGATGTVDGYGATGFGYSPSTSDRNNRFLITYPALVSDEQTSYSVDTIILHSDTSSKWKASVGTPGWYRASVVKKLVEEADSRNVYGFDSAMLSFTDTVDTDKKPWTDRGQFSFDIGSTTVLDVLEQFSETDIDWHFDAATWTLDCWSRAGTDRTNTIRLFPGHSLRAMDTSSDSRDMITWICAKKANEYWTSYPSESPTKRIEAGLSMGSTDSEHTVQYQIQQMLNDYSSPQLSFSIETSPVIGPQPYEDFFLGDTILVPGNRGEGVVPARVLSITCDFSDDIPVITPELVLDPTSPSFEA